MRTTDVIKGAENVDPVSVAAYLGDRRWKRRGKAGPGVETWVHRLSIKEPTVSVLLPVDRSLADFVPLMRRAVETIAEAEGLAVDDLLLDVREPSSAVMRLGVELELDPEAGIPLGVAAAMIDTLVRATSSAAEETAASLETLEQWEQSAARGYLTRVRLAHTEPGSYVMKVFLPDKLIAGDPGRGHSVVQTLVADLRRLREVTLSPDPPGVLVEELHDWNFGSQVIHAIARVEDDRLDSFFLDVEPGRGEGRYTEHLRLDRQDRDRIRDLDHLLPTAAAQAVAEAGAKLPYPLPAAQEVQNVALEGEVIRLARPDVTVLATVEDRARRVLVQKLSPDLYEVAYQAHGNEQRVQLVGTLIVRGDRLVMRDVVRAELLDV